MVDTPRKTFPELAALSAPLVDSDVVAVYRAPGPAKRTTASVLKTYAQTGLGTMATQNANAVAITGGTILGITDLAVADGGTGASTADAALTNLGGTAAGKAVFTAATVAAQRTALAVPGTADLAANTGAGTIGTTAGISVQAALNALSGPGPLTPVTRVGFVPARYTAPSGMNNPLRVWVDCDGEGFSFNKRPYSLTDWTQTPGITGVTDIYVDYISGNDANAGTSVGAAWKTFDKAVLSSPDKSIIHLLNPTVGYLSALNGNFQFSTRRVKIIGDHASGPTRFSGWRETYTAAFMSWVASGSAFTSTAAANLSTIQAMGDDNYRDSYGLPLAMPHVASAATCLTTPGSWNWDGTTLTVHMIDARTPDPANGWIPITSFSNAQFLSDVDIAFENISAFYNGGAAAIQGIRWRPTTTGAANTIKVALKNCRAFGSSGNAFQINDAYITAMQDCYGAHCFFDIFNYSSFISTGTQAQWATVYEDNCFGHDAGYSWRQNPTASNSNNLSTAHRGFHVWRVNPSGYNIPNSFLADVNGVYCINFNVTPSQSTAGTLFQNNYWYQRLSGEGSAGAKMIVIGGNGDAVPAGQYHFSNWNDAETAASLGEIYLSDWQGPSSPNIRAGTLLFNYKTGAAL